MEYGYINESGYLRTQILEERKEMYRDKDYNLKSRIITIEEQAKALSGSGWKPVDEIDCAKLQTDEGYIIRVMPYDAGERISFRYEKVEDKNKTKREIEELKSSIESSDYKIIKCYEASLTGEIMPYDITSLHQERQIIRNRINELEAKL